METILNLSPHLANGSLTFEIQTRTQSGGNAWEEVEVFTENELQEVANMMWEYANNGVLVEWTLL